MEYNDFGYLDSILVDIKTIDDTSITIFAFCAEVTL
jgi:hypothetical protein